MKTSTTISDERIEWREATRRLGDLFVNRFKNIRRDVPADDIVAVAVNSVMKAFPPLTVGADQEPLGIDGSMMKDLIDEINRNHRERILRLANSIGEVVEDIPPRDDIAADIDGRYAGEDESHVFMRVDGFTIKIGKDTAMKILALGAIP